MTTEHHSTRAARRRAQGRVRAARWRERHAAELAALRETATAAEVDTALAAGLVERHAALRAGSQHRDVALPLVDVLAAARARLRAAGLDPDAAREAVMARIAHHAGMIDADSCAMPNRA